MYINGWIVLGFCIAFVVSLIAAVAFGDRSRIAEHENVQLGIANEQQRERLRRAQEFIAEKLHEIACELCDEHGHPDKSMLSNNVTADMYYASISPVFTEEDGANIIKLVLGKRGEIAEATLMTVRVDMQQEPPVTIDGKPVPLITSGSVDDIEDRLYDFLADFSFVQYFESQLLEEEGEEILGPLDDHFITVN